MHGAVHCPCRLKTLAWVREGLHDLIVTGRQCHNIFKVGAHAEASLGAPKQALHAEEVTGGQDQPLIGGIRRPCELQRRLRQPPGVGRPQAALPLPHHVQAASCARLSNDDRAPRPMPAPEALRYARPLQSREVRKQRHVTQHYGIRHELNSLKLFGGDHRENHRAVQPQSQHLRDRVDADCFRHVAENAAVPDEGAERRLVARALGPAAPARVAIAALDDEDAVQALPLCHEGLAPGDLVGLYASYQHELLVSRQNPV
mmetsp:Transcript_14948/g.43687  ORF Transcript_14948/g.43687 Transcript_14948/m.43687 type:complete len:259 (+) Transcript_14948:1551-2327(+)